MKRPKILVADDDCHIRSALKTRLDAWGYRIVEAHDGLGVIALASRENVAAMILDHEMPNGNGRTVVNMIRKECDAPIIFLSGHDRESFGRITFALPDIYYMRKPLDAAHLQNLLFDLLGTIEIERACA